MMCNRKPIKTTKPIFVNIGGQMVKKEQVTISYKVDIFEEMLAPLKEDIFWTDMYNMFASVKM